jgi:hypothetical protein
LTPDQLEEFEAVFLHFDRDRTNSLGNGEFGAALASLGLNYEPDEMEEVFYDVSAGKGRVDFEQFIRFMVPPVCDVTKSRWNCMRINLRLIRYGWRSKMSQKEKYVLFGGVTDYSRTLQSWICNSL